MQKTTASLATPGLIGPRSWTQAATVQPRSKATSARAAGAAGLEMLNMSLTLNTEPWNMDQDPQAPSLKLQADQAPSSQHQAPGSKPQA